MTKNNHARRKKQKEKAKLTKAAQKTRAPLVVSSGVNTAQIRAGKRVRPREGNSKAIEEEEEEDEEDEENASKEMVIGMASTTRHISPSSIECDAQSPQPPVVVSKEQWPPCSDDSTHSVQIRIPIPHSSLPQSEIGCRNAQSAQSPIVVSKEQWDPCSDASTGTPLSPCVRLPGGLASQQADAFLHRYAQPSPLDAVTGRGNINGLSRWRKRPTAADLNDRAEEEYQQNERAKRLATVDIRASADVAFPSDRIDAVSLPLMPQRSRGPIHNEDLRTHPSPVQLDEHERMCEQPDNANSSRLSEKPETSARPTQSMLTHKRRGDDLSLKTDLKYKKQKVTVPVQPKKMHRGSKGGQHLLGHNNKDKTQPIRQEPVTRSAVINFPKFGNLPDNVKDIILGMLLKSNETLQMKPKWADPKPPYGITTPTTMFTLIKGPGMVATQYLEAPHIFQHKLDLFRVNLQHAPRHSLQQSMPSLHGLTLTLLCVSKTVNERAARMLYSDNIFEFDGGNAWLLLEAFLATIGSKNVGYLQHLRVSAPKWFPNSSVDAISGVLMDSLRPDIGLAKRADPSEDRLLSAITKCTHMLARSGTLKCLEIKIPRMEVKGFLDFRSEDWRCVLADAEQANHEKRKDKGVRLFRAMSDALGPGCKPLLVVQVGQKVSWLLKTVEERWFADRLPSLLIEAERYGWGVDPEMREWKK